MASYKHTGTITFIQHDRQFITIDYLALEKTKSINASMLSFKEKKEHTFRMGDVIGFNIKPTPRGDKLMAVDMVFLYNNALQSLIQKAVIQNRFTGYLKKADDQYFIKDPGSYILFPLLLSPWEQIPKAELINESIEYCLNNIEKPEKVTASLFKPSFITPYKKAMKCYKEKSTVAASVTKVTPFGINMSLYEGAIQAKITFAKDEKANALANSIKVGDVVNVFIAFVGPQKIVLQVA